LGAWVAGRLPYKNPMRLYAALEIVIAVCALLLPFALHATTPLLAWAYADGNAPARFAMVRVAISLLLLGIPATAMGATFPIAAAWLSRAGGLAASAAGTLYAANTVGAAMGAIAAGFWLIPALGLRGTTWIGVALNVVAAAGALWLTTKTAEAGERAQTNQAYVRKTETGRIKNKKNSSLRPLRLNV